MGRKFDDKLGEMLDAAELKKTRARLLILDVLLKAGTPLTQEQIGQELGDLAPNKVTIYRALQSLTETEIVHEAFTKDRATYFELGHNCSAHQCHPHFTCTSCNETQCMVGVKIPMAKLPNNGFTVEHQKVELQGLCPSCSKN